MLSVLVTIKIKPGFEESVVDGLAAIQAKSRGDAGCVAFHWFQHASDPLSYSLFEQWESKEAMDAHVDDALLAKEDRTA